MRVLFARELQRAGDLVRAEEERQPGEHLIHLRTTKQADTTPQDCPIDGANPRDVDDARLWHVPMCAGTAIARVEGTMCGERHDRA